MGQLWMSPYDIVPKGYRVTCKKCGAETGLKNTPEEAAAAWNMRKEKNDER